MKLTKEEIVRVEDDSPLELFKQGIRSKETLDKYTRTLQQITCKILEDVLEGTFEERVQQLVDMGRKDPKWMRDMLVKLSGKLASGPSFPRTTATTSTRTRSGTTSSPSRSCST